MCCRLLKSVCFSAAAFVAMGMAANAVADFVGPTMASSQFGPNGGYQYEMDVMPSTLDLDNNGTLDLDAHESTPGNVSVSGSKLTIIDSSGGSDYVGAEAAGKIWQARFASGDYTVECSAKVLSTVGDETGQDGAFQLYAGNGNYAFIKLTGTNTNVSGAYGGTSTLLTDNNMNIYHTYRMAKQGSAFYVWRDGALIGDGLSFPAGSPSFYIGDGGGWINGSTSVDYVRLIGGAYAPVPEPSALALLISGMLGLLAYAWRKSKSVAVVAVALVIMGIGPQANADLTTRDSSAFQYQYEFDSAPPSGEISLVGGNLTDVPGNWHVTTSAYADATDGIWVNSDWLTGWTMEARVKIANGTDLHPFAIEPGKTGWNYYGCLTVDQTGEEWGSQTWGGASNGQFNPLGTGSQLTTSNTDTYHIFRMVQRPGSNSWIVWRDGVQLDSTNNGGRADYICDPGYKGTDSSAKWCYIGDWGGNFNGAAYLDYLRVDLTGAYAPAPTPEPSTLVLVGIGLLGLPAYAWRKRK